MIGLSDRDISELLTPKELVAAVEAAARLHDEGRAVVPARHHLVWSGNILLTMPAVAAGALGTKLVSVVPNNTARGLPVTNGLMVLNDAETGLPLALLNAAALTAQRTGAVGALGTKYMTPVDLDSVGIVGTGVQGTWQAVVACAVRPIREVFCVCRSSASGERFAMAVKQHAPEVQLTRCRSASELLTRTSLVITATTSIEPVLPDKPALLEGKHFISIGSFRPNMQELPDSDYRLTGDREHPRQHNERSSRRADEVWPLRRYHPGSRRDRSHYRVQRVLVRSGGPVRIYPSVNGGHKRHYCECGLGAPSGGGR